MANGNGQAFVFGFSPKALEARFVLNPEVILRDESRYHPDLYLVRLVRQGVFYCVDKIAFDCLVYLFQPRRLQDVINYYLRVGGYDVNKETIQNFKTLMAKLVMDEVVWHLPKGTSYTPPSRPIYLQVPKDFQYPSVYEPFSFPFNVTFVPTAYCNLKCLHCMASQLPRGKGELSLEEIFGLLTSLDEAGTWSLKISGGEPMTHPQIEDILLYAARCRFSVAFLTNATLINEQNITTFATVAQMKGKNGFALGISLDGASAETHEWLRRVPGSFWKTLHALELLKQANIPFNINSIIHRKNLHELEKMIELAFDKGATSIAFVIPCPLGRASGNKELAFLSEEVRAIGEKFARLQEKYPNVSFEHRHMVFPKQFHPLPWVKSKNRSTDTEFITPPPGTCPAGMTHMAISSYGIVYPCIDALGVDDMAMGNIREEDVVQIWRKNSWNLFRGGFTFDQLWVCNTCSSREYCGVMHCRAYPWASLGDPYGPKPECLRNFKGLGIPPEIVRRFKDKLVPLFDGEI